MSLELKKKRKYEHSEPLIFALYGFNFKEYVLEFMLVVNIYIAIYIPTISQERLVTGNRGKNLLLKLTKENR